MSDPGETFPGSGEAGALLHGWDWSQTSLEDASNWPLGLTTVVRVILNSGQPMFLAWGPDRTLLYNDGYSDMLGARHPTAYGDHSSRPGRKFATASAR